MILRRAANVVETPALGLTPDRHWLDVIPNGTADHLAAWLRAEADSAACADAYMAWVGRADAATDAMERRHEHPLALARAILGEAS